MCRINEKALAVTLSLIYGVMMFAIGLLSALTGWGRNSMDIYGEFFPGFGPSIAGSIIGLIFGLVFGAVLGYAIGIIYNCVSAKMGCKQKG